MTKLELFNTSLQFLRDSFHKYGKFSDSNAKLDEIGKLFSIYLFDSIVAPNKKVINRSMKKFQNDKVGFVLHLNNIFRQISSDCFFRLVNGESIFGNSPSLNLEMNDDYFSYNVLKLIDDTYDGFKKKNEQFDFLNEVFGHFIRDNFRNNIEDAQYLTPQEIVDIVCKIAQIETKKQKELIVCDPCCGVGSFLRTFGKLNKSISQNSFITLVGQDKVPRMARFSKLNLNLIENVPNEISIGNSLIGNSYIDSYLGKIDLILTNPPFGARFNSLELIGEDNKKYPILFDLFRSASSINSEVLFVDKCLALLKNGGQLYAVLPDSVISSNGIQEILRYRINQSDSVFVKSIIELPVEAFAQAGTRTKTSILHLIKSPKTTPNKVFIAKSNNLGFEVSTRKGVTIKKEVGENDLIKIFDNYQLFLSQTTAPSELPKVLNENPSCVEIEPQQLIIHSWTPNHYDAVKLKSLNYYRDSNDFNLVNIGELLEIITKARRKEKRCLDSKCISVLHIVTGDLLDFEELLKYNPKYPGIVCKPGDLLFSKINPRIHRTLVVPELGLPLTCSSEFEILRSISEYNNYQLKFLLSLPVVKKQLNHLTSGTSSSHNRIKTKDFLKIQMPLPNENSKSFPLFKETLSKIEIQYKKLIQLNIEKVKVVSKLVEDVYT